MKRIGGSPANFSLCAKQKDDIETVIQKKNISLNKKSCCLEKKINFFICQQNLK